MDKAFEAVLTNQLHNLHKLLVTEHGREIYSLRKENEQLNQRLEQATHDTSNGRSLGALQKGVSAVSSPTSAAFLSERHPEPSSGYPTPSSGYPSPQQAPMRPTCETDEISMRKLWSEVAISVHPDFVLNGDTPGKIPSSPVVASSSTRQSFVSFKDPGGLRAGDERIDQGWEGNFRCLVSHPLTGQRLAYDIFTMVLIWYDLLTIPMEFSGLLGEGKLIQVFTWLMTVCWTIDLFQGFFRGYEEHGIVELRLKNVMFSYLKSWFFLDFALVALDWIIALLTMNLSFAGVARSAKTLRLWRALRMLKFLRFYRMPRIYHDVERMFRNEFAQSALRIGTWICGILVLNHIIACLWFQIGSSTTGPSWVTEATMAYRESADGEDPTNLYMYTTALHWATTQFTPASMEVVPQNSAERLYTIFMLFFSLVLFPSFLSSITNNVAQLRQKNAAYSEARRNLVRFLQENRLSLELSSRIQSIVSEQYEKMRNVHRIHEPEVKLLQLLPRSLKEEMHLQIYEPTLSNHPFFRVLTGVDDQALLKICHVAMSQESLKSGQELFTYGKEAERAFCIVAGKLRYHKGPGIRNQEGMDIGQGAFICDMVLWMHWEHRGSMTASTPCELAVVDGAAFRCAVRARPAARDLCCNFATQYAAAVLQGNEPTSQACSDLGFGADKMREFATASGFPSGLRF